jgi:hypothetical protein
MANFLKRGSCRYSISLYNDRQANARLLKGFVIDTLSDGREASLSNLVRLARERGVLKPHASARALNMTLINLQRRGSTERLSNGLWRKVKPPDDGHEWKSNGRRIKS